MMTTKYKTNDPYEIAKVHDIKVSHEPLPEHIGGFYTTIFEYEYIVINSEKTEDWKRAIAAHELGHAQLHNHNQPFLPMIDFFIHSKLEKEANQFGDTLCLISENRVEE